MRHDNHHNLLIWLLALVVVFAPMQVAVSAIDMLSHQHGKAPHCHMAMTGDMDHAALGHGAMKHDCKRHGDCCKQGGACQGSCASCAQYAATYVALFAQLFVPAKATQQFIPQKISLSKGINGQSDYRPPRRFS